MQLHERKFSFFAPHRLSVQKVQTSSITPNSVQVSPPPPSRIMTAYSLTEWQIAFVGPHHMPKILGKNHQSTTKVTLNEPPIIYVIPFHHPTILSIEQTLEYFSCIYLVIQTSVCDMKKHQRHQQKTPASFRQHYSVV